MKPQIIISGSGDNADQAALGIIRMNFQMNGLSVCLRVQFGIEIEMHLYLSAPNRVLVCNQGTEKPREIGRAAGTAEPRLTFRKNMPFVWILLIRFRKYGKRIYIEKPGHVQAHAGKTGVVQGPFHCVGIDPLCFPEQHPVGEEDQRHRGTGFRIGRIVRKIIIKGKCLAGICRSDAARHIHPLPDDVFKLTLTGLPQFPVPGAKSDVRSTAGKVKGPHCVSLRCKLLPDRQMALGISTPVTLVPRKERLIQFFLLLVEIVRFQSAPVNEGLRKLKILPFTGQIGQLAKREFYFGMPREASEVLCRKPQMNMIRVPDHDIQHLALARRLIVGDCAFQQMTGTVKLMAVPEIGPSPFHSVADKVGIQITVVPLRFLQQVNGPVRTFFQFRIRRGHQFITERFDPFPEIAVLEHHAVKSALLLSGGKPEVINAMGRFSPGDFIVQHLPLIPQKMPVNSFHNGSGKTACNLPAPGQNTRSDQLLIHGSLLLKSRLLSRRFYGCTITLKGFFVSVSTVTLPFSVRSL